MTSAQIHWGLMTSAQIHWGADDFGENKLHTAGLDTGTTGMNE